MKKPCICPDRVHVAWGVLFYECPAHGHILTQAIPYPPLPASWHGEGPLRPPLKARAVDFHAANRRFDMMIHGGMSVEFPRP